MAQDFVLVVDCGGGNPQHIARSVRGNGIYCEIAGLQNGWTDIVSRHPSGIIALGGTAGGDGFPPELLEGGVPILAIGEAARALALGAGGQAHEVILEKKLCRTQFIGKSALFQDLDSDFLRVERAYDFSLPRGFERLAVSQEGATLAFGDAERRLFGLQFQIERNDIDGYRIIASFVRRICECEAKWTLETYIETALEGLRNRVGDGIAVCQITGGVDTAVSAALAHRALGERCRCVFVDAGLLCQGEAEALERAFLEVVEVPLLRIPARERFIEILRGVTSQREKQRLLAQAFAAIFREQGDEIRGGEKFVIRGTIYNDLLDGVAIEQAPEGWTPLDPIRGLFKYEVRQLAEKLGLPGEIAQRQPFPDGGLAIRCLGEVTGERLDVLLYADATFKRKVLEAGADKGLRQYFAALAPPRPDGGGETVVLRAVQNREGGKVEAARLSYDLLEDVVRELHADRRVARVVYDLSTKPPAGIEFA